MTNPDVHPTAHHTVDDILAMARRPEAADPTEIHVGSAIHARMLKEAAGAATRMVVDEQRGISRLDGIPVVVDAEIPAYPGYEIHRDCASTQRGRAA